MAVQQQTDNKPQIGPLTSTQTPYISTTATEPTSHTNQYEPPANDSIIQGANTAPGSTSHRQYNHINGSQHTMEKQ